MEKSDAVSFISSYFKLEPNEDKDTNPGIYGNALARWIAERLRERGISTKEIVPEDRGWCVIVKTKPVRLNIAVSNIDGDTNRWRVFAFAERGLFQMFKSSNELKREIAALRNHLAAIIAIVPGIQDVSWEPLS